MRRFCALSLALAGMLALLASPASGECPSSVVESLLAADRHFAADADLRGLDGWTSHFAIDATAFSNDGNVVRGKAELDRYYATVFPSANALPRWDPLHADCSSDGSLGFTYGNWRSRDGKGGHGQYITVWRRQSDGKWMVLFDLGNTKRLGP